jgi:hypothetical protein
LDDDSGDLMLSTHTMSDAEPLTWIDAKRRRESDDDGDGGGGGRAA